MTKFLVENGSPDFHDESRGSLFLGVILLWWLILYWTFCSAWPRPFDDWKNGIFYTGAGLIFFYIKWRRRSQQAGLSLNLPVLCLIFYFFAAFLSLIGKDVPRYEGFLALARLFLWVALIWSLAQLKKSEWATIARFSVVSAALIGLASFIQIRSYPLWNYSGLFMAPIGHISYYGDFMALHVPLGFYLFFSSVQHRAKILWGVCLFLIFLALWIAGTRASMVGLALSLVFTCLVMGWRGRIGGKKIIIGASMMTAIVLLFALIQPQGPRKGITAERMSDLLKVRSWDDVNRVSSGRWNSYLATVGMITKKPVTGWGMGSYRFIYPDYSPKKTEAMVSASVWYMHPHNEILNQGAEVGLLGLLPLGLGVLFLYGKGMEGMRRDKHGPVLLGMTGLGVSLISWQFSTNFLFPLSRLLTAFYLALLWKEMAPAMKSYGEISFKKSGLVLTGLALFCVLFLGAYHGSLYALWKSYRAESLESNLKWVDLSYRLAPGAFDSLYAYALAHRNQGNLEEALPAIDRLHASYPFVPMTLYLKALASLHRGKAEEAKGYLRHALANDPGFEMAKEVLQGLEGVTPPPKHPPLPPSQENK